ncbi:hypothetical protein ENBRE01_0338 [Enteropsectra breve]|nr:hypothetical protein ENBRE01_0338 [Enteropsectra breve]
MVIPLICNSATNTKRVPTPDHYSTPPGNVICPNCNTQTDTEYKRDYHRCDICFCCCIPCGSSNAYLACTGCGLQVSTTEIFRCSSCKTATTFNSRFCPKCGSRK